MCLVCCYVSICYRGRDPGAGSVHYGVTRNEPLPDGFCVSELLLIECRLFNPGWTCTHVEIDVI